MSDKLSAWSTLYHSVSQKSTPKRKKVPAGVYAGSEFRRIAALPVKTWDKTLEKTLVEHLTEQLRTPSGEYTLRPVQALMLAEAYKMQGLFAHVGVGHGKTLTSALIPTLVACERPCIMVPAKLASKTKAEIEEWSEHFNIRADITVLKYSGLSSAKGPRELLALAPDLIVCDEAHLLKNIRSGRTKRFKRYVKHTQPKIFAMSGTLLSGDIEHFAQICDWALKDNSPLPRSYNGIREWGYAINSAKAFKKMTYKEKKSRLPAGALEAFLKPGEERMPDPQRARRAVINRLKQSWGVVITESDSCDKDITINVNDDLPKSEEMDEYLSDLTTMAVGPNGEEYIDKLEMYRVGRQLSMGFYSKWVPPPKEEWLEARRDYNRLCLQIIRSGRADTPKQAANLVPDSKVVHEWYRRRAQYEYEVVPTWLSDCVVDYAIEWARTHQGIVWVEQVPLGRRIAEKGLPYFGAGDEDALREHTGPAALSIKAHGTGRNLQRYHKNLVLSCPPSGGEIEQMMGRTHRQGQARNVHFEFLAHTAQLRGGLAIMDLDSQDQQEISQQPQKLQQADATLTQLIIGD